MLAIRPSPLDPRRAHVRFGPLTLDAALGIGGMTAFKREGDGATPIGSLEVLSGFRKGGYKAIAPARVELHRTGRGDGWCDAPGHAAYNRPVRLPFAASHEKLLREDCLYNFVLVVDWNFRQRRRGAGSAIFVHVAKPGFPPTQGCIAFRERDLIRLLPHVGRGARFLVRRS
ncbi:hypothetical protein KY465_05845 [Pseudohoeflea sp. DP4N28-3]|uniref:L,D-TPase catalytic domain-containing protein n=1 Tax=Pseudohoeflea coraliihabitans TaxID=2860393 RepID=A0ABS6WLH9_9HYPH|nr:hypothetical protein [Pseudohoeflea sp. DP4N28-3]